MGMLLFVYPFCEIATWYWFIDRYSFWDAILLCLSSGAVGLIIVSMQGRALLTEMSQAQMQAWRQGDNSAPPARAFQRLAIIFGGLLMFLPGLLSKIIGTFLILPGFRHLTIWTLKKQFASRVVVKGFDFFMSNVPEGPRDVVEIRPTTIEHKDKDSQEP